MRGVFLCAIGAILSIGIIAITIGGHRSAINSYWPTAKHSEISETITTENVLISNFSYYEDSKLAFCESCNFRLIKRIFELCSEDSFAARGNSLSGGFFIQYGRYIDFERIFMKPGDPPMSVFVRGRLPGILYQQMNLWDFTNFNIGDVSRIYKNISPQLFFGGILSASNKPIGGKPQLDGRQGQQGIKKNKPQSEKSNGVLGHPLPEGFAAFTLYLFGSVFCVGGLIILIWNRFRKPYRNNHD